MVNEQVPEGKEPTFRKNSSIIEEDEPDMHSVLGFLN